MWRRRRTTVVRLGDVREVSARGRRTPQHQLPSPLKPSPRPAAPLPRTIGLSGVSMFSPTERDRILRHEIPGVSEHVGPPPS